MIWLLRSQKALLPKQARRNKGAQAPFFVTRFCI